MKLINNNMHSPSYLKAAIAFRATFKKFTKSVLRIMKDAYDLDKKRFINVMITSPAGIALLGFSIGVLFKYVHNLETGSNLRYMNYTLNTRAAATLIVISVISMLLLVMGAGLLLYARLITRDILVEYHLSNLKKVAGKFGWSPSDNTAWINDTMFRNDIRSLYMGDSQKSAYGMRRLFEGYQHFLITFGGIAVLLWLDAKATLSLVLIILISFFFFSKINSRASGSTRKYENISSESSRRAKALLENIATWPNPHLDSKTLEIIASEELIKDNARLLFDRFATRSMAEFLSYTIMAVAFGFLVIKLGYDALEGKKNWSSIVAYMLVLRTVMQSLKNFLKMINETARIFPSLSRLYEFNKDSVPSYKKDKIKKFTIFLSADSISEKGKNILTINRGDVVILSTPVSLSRYSITFFSRILAGNKSKPKKKLIRQMAYLISIAVPIRPPAIPVSLRDVIGIPRHMSENDLNTLLRIKAGGNKKTVTIDPDIPLTKKQVENLPVDLFRQLSLLPCLISDRPFFLVEHSLVSDKWLKDNKELLKDKILIICHSGLPGKQINRLKSVSTCFVAASDGEIVFAGTINKLNAKRNDVLNILNKHEKHLISKSSKLILSVYDDDDDDDE